MPMPPRPTSRRTSYLPSFCGRILEEAFIRWTYAGKRALFGRARLFVLAVDVPDTLLHQTLHHRVERDAALGRVRNAGDRRRFGADLLLLLGVILRNLVRGRGIENLVAHADAPDSGCLGGVDRAGH